MAIKFIRQQIDLPGADHVTITDCVIQTNIFAAPKINHLKLIRNGNKFSSQFLRNLVQELERCSEEIIYFEGWGYDNVMRINQYQINNLSLENNLFVFNHQSYVKQPSTIGYLNQ
ncbi:Hypothetical_protein [Hexamita inflata]|uniref:Hypothetical_protein n=1 Tax=Hexamita inflata TaxID=28002 RepID=A0AA86QV49_9EUKA|nr:Hypothetical protein HINF_LOCUS48982 [Hexamita inflata]